MLRGLGQGLLRGSDSASRASVSRAEYGVAAFSVDFAKLNAGLPQYRVYCLNYAALAILINEHLVRCEVLDKPDEAPVGGCEGAQLLKEPGRVPIGVE